MNAIEILNYSANQQAMFSHFLAECGYKTFTTFFGDLSIAECCGKSAVQDTFNRVCKEWGNDYKYFTEFVMALNHKISEWYGKDDDIAILYNDLWIKAEDMVFDGRFTDEEIQYYYQVTD